MHNEREENSITRPRETERLNGELEIDYQRNRVMFHPNALREFRFNLPLTPSDVDVVGAYRRLIEKWKHTVSATTYETNKEAMDQTRTEKRADLFRVHLLGRRGLVIQVAPLQLVRNGSNR